MGSLLSPRRRVKNVETKLLDEEERNNYRSMRENDKVSTITNTVLS